MKTRSRWFVLAGVLAALLLFAGACGDDDSASDDSSSQDASSGGDDGGGDSDQFMSDLDDLCAEADEAITEAGDDLEDALTEVGEAFDAGDEDARVDALEDAESAVEDALGTIDGFVSDVEELDRPEDLQEDVDEYLDLLDQRRALLQDLRDALADDDAEAFDEAIAELEQNDGDLEEAATEAAESIGSEECIPDED